MGLVEDRYDVLGSSLEVRCRSRACAEQVGQFLGPMATEAWTTPDWIVECSSDEPPPGLFQARSWTAGPLEGVRVRFAKGGGYVAWRGADAALLPLSFEPLANRFVALHGGLVAIDNQYCVALVGSRASGKTSLALQLTNRHSGCSFLGDERIFLLRRTRIAQPLPLSVGLRVGNGARAWYRADEIANRVDLVPHQVTHVVLLDGWSSGEVVCGIDSLEAFRSLQDHRRYGGSTSDEETVTLARFCRWAAFSRTGLTDFGNVSLLADKIYSWVCDSG